MEETCRTLKRRQSAFPKGWNFLNWSCDVIFFFFFFVILFSVAAACTILSSPPGIEPVPPAIEAESPNHWAIREVPGAAVLNAGSASWTTQNRALILRQWFHYKVSSSGELEEATESVQNSLKKTNCIKSKEWGDRLLELPLFPHFLCSFKHTSESQKLAKAAWSLLPSIPSEYFKYQKIFHLHSQGGIFSPLNLF